MGFQDSRWKISASSLVILAASIIDIYCADKQPDRRTDIVVVMVGDNYWLWWWRVYVCVCVCVWQHQQQVAAAVERAKQVTMQELNAIIGVSEQVVLLSWSCVWLQVTETERSTPWAVKTCHCWYKKSKNLPRNTGLVVQNKVACFYGPCMVYSRIADNMIEVHRERFWWLVQAYAYCIGCTSILHCLGLLSLPSCVARTVKWIYDFELSSNNKWRWWMWTVAVPADSQPE